jgi:hypothetical protein
MRRHLLGVFEETAIEQIDGDAGRPEAVYHYNHALVGFAQEQFMIGGIGDAPPKVRFASDSPLEGDGFELPVPGCEKVSPFRGIGTVREVTNGGISKWELMLDRWFRSVPRIRLVTQ